MPSYDDRYFSPPAPVARVTLREPQNDTTLSDVLMLIDYGADITLLPQSCVEILGAEIHLDEGYELMGFDGTKSKSGAVTLDLLFLRKTFKGRFPLVNQDYGILGRNVLNHVALVLDGPQLTWDEK